MIGIAEPSRQLGQNIAAPDRLINYAPGHRVFGDFIGRRHVEEAFIEAYCAEPCPEPLARDRVGAAVQRKGSGAFGAFAVQYERKIGDLQTQPHIVLQAMRRKAVELVVPAQIRVAVIRSWRDIGARRAGEPLHGMVSLTAALAQPAAVDAMERPPIQSAHPAPVTPGAPCGRRAPSIPASAARWRSVFRRAPGSAWPVRMRPRPVRSSRGRSRRSSPYPRATSRANERCKGIAERGTRARRRTPSFGRPPPGCYPGRRR